MSMNCFAYELYWNVLSINMNPIATQQAALDNALVSSEKRLKIERCNARIAFSKPQREETYQVTLEALKLSPCYLAFVITAEVPQIYMHQFWNTITKIRDTYAYSFKLDKKKCRFDTEVFHEILQICPRILNQDFIAPPSKEDLVTFIQELGYSSKCNMLSVIHTDQMHQPWRTFAAIINRCISGKTTGLDRLGESRAQILWGMYNKKNFDYVALLQEDFMYQADNREISSARKEHMPYPRFTKVIINHFISKYKTIFMRNKINLHTIRDDSLLGTLKFVSKTQDYQQYGALIPDDMINQDIKDSQAYKTYYDFATGKVPPRKARKYKKVASPLRKLSPVKEAEPVKKGKELRDLPRSLLLRQQQVLSSEILLVSLSEAAQLKEATKRSKKDYHISQASGSGDGTNFESGVPDEQQRKTSGTDKGTGTKPGVPDVHTYDSESKNKSWGDSEDDNDDDSDDGSKDDDDKNPSFTLKDYDEEEHDEEYESDDDNENVFEEEDDDLYKDVDVRSLGAKQEQERKGDEEMTDADQNVLQEQPYEQVVEDAHVTLTASQKTDDSKQSSSMYSDFANQFLILEKAPPSDHEVASLMNIKMSQEVPSTQIPSPITEPATVILDSSTIASTTVPPTISMISPLPQLMTPTPAPITALTTTSIPALPDFSSLFGFDQRVSTLETELSQLKQSTIIESLENVVLAKSSSQPQSTYEAPASLTEFELKKILLDKLEKGKSYRAAKDHRNLYDALIKSYQLDKDLLDSYGKAYSLKRSCDDNDKDEDPPAGSDQGLKKKKSSKDVEPLRGPKSKESKTSSSKGTKSQPKSSGKSVQAEEPVFEIADTEMPQDQGGNAKDQPYVEATPMDEWFKKPNKPLTPDRPWNDGKSIDSRQP
ncbi:hypothetical protein Tco_0951177 [Tanacetum coccineum]|uniref:Uncharacterized protein n=1 Tax=Tanacetum coccineum TaxID=301880 RepID=A0ABQ5DTI1_9ASTR